MATKFTGTPKHGQGVAKRDPAPTGGVNSKTPKEPSTVATSSADSASADPDARHRSLDQPVGEVTRNI